MRREVFAAGVCAVGLLLTPTAALGQPIGSPGPGRPRSEVPPPSTLGDLTFPNSGAKRAQPEFIKGVLLLHNFEYEDARAAFRRAEAIDPNFAMAYWGEALTHYHPLWLEKDSGAARGALARLGANRQERAAKAGMAHERAFLAAVEDLFAAAAEGGKEDKLARDLQYERALHALYEDENRRQAGGDNAGVEAAALYALAIVSAQQGKRDVPAYMRAARILEGAYGRNPNHPGVVHYLIHTYDDPDNARLGVCAAERYSQIAADAPHAKHMPSHIWHALGRWADLVDSNEQAWAASEKQVARDRMGSERRDWHSLRFVQYGYLQQRRFSKAQRALNIVLADASVNPSPRLRWHMFRMRAAQIVEAENWTVPAYRGSADGIDAAAVAGDLFASGFAAVNRGDLPAARTALDRLQRVHDEDGTATAAHSSHQHPPHGFGTADKSIPIAKMMGKQLTGLIAIAENRRPAGLEALQSAAADADRQSFDYGPPNPIKPVYELLGETYLRFGDAPKALEAFGKALQRDPRRYLSLRGQATAADRAGQPKVAAQARAQMREIEAFGTKPPRQCTSKAQPSPPA